MEFLFASGKRAMPLLWLVALRCDYERDGPSKAPNWPFILE